MNLLAAMRYLAALHAHGHFARAAQACHITQPTLSNALRALETEFGVPIVRRGRVFAGFTPEGEQVLQTGLEMLQSEASLRQRLSAQGSTGSSTMPHKVNPIRFENAEANLEVSNALLDNLSATLVTSRLQRDLTDSSSQRTIGIAFGHSLLAIANVTRGLAGLDVDAATMARDLDTNWEVLGEAVQSAMRAAGIAGATGMADPYERLKDLTRGRGVDGAGMRAFIGDLGLPDDVEARLLALDPASYVGYSAQLVNHLA